VATEIPGGGDRVRLDLGAIGLAGFLADIQKINVGILEHLGGKEKFS
jgi:hypothetical protein